MKIKARGRVGVKDWLYHATLDLKASHKRLGN